MYSKGISWIDDCRIPFVDDGDIKSATPFGNMNGVKIYGRNSFNESKTEFDTKINTQGRFPANILVSDDMLNDGTNNKSTVYKGNLLDIRGNKYGIDAGQKLDYGYDRGYSDKGTNSRYYDIDKWFEKLLND
jgi:hypothetical protein